MKRRIKRSIVRKALIFAVLLCNTTVSFTLGRATANSHEVPPESPEEVVSQESVGQENTIEIDEPIYYDCPLDHELQDYIREMCAEKGIPMSLVIAQIEVESSFRLHLISGTNDYGLMQINKVNHEWLSEQYGITDFLDPYQSVFCGITILSQHYNQYQQIERSLMAYNLGATGAKRLWDKGIYETHYTRKIMKAMEVYENEI